MESSPMLDLSASTVTAIRRIGFGVAVSAVVPIHAVIVIALLLIPAVCWLLIDLAELKPPQAIAGVVSMFVIAGAGLMTG